MPFLGKAYGAGVMPLPGHPAWGVWIRAMAPQGWLPGPAPAVLSIVDWVRGGNAHFHWVNILGHIRFWDIPVVINVLSLS